MDLNKIIRDLFEERTRLSNAIAHLEMLRNRASAGIHEVRPTKRRGRREMSPAERQLVSERIKKYWASRAGSTENTQ